MSDRISLRGMRFLGRHGVELEERLEPQPIEVDVELELDLAAPAASDELSETIDYAVLFDLVRGIVEEQSFRLLEALAGAIARAALAATDPAIVGGVEVRVRKPRALDGDLDGPEITLRRDRARA